MEIIRRAGSKKKSLPILPLEIEPIPFEPKLIEKRIAIFDTETDPFAHGRIVEPFTCGFYLTDSNEYWDFWNDPKKGTCIDQFFRFLRSEFVDEELLILVHNGGNFDFYFFIDQFDSDHKPFIINGRLVRVMAGGQEWRDSYAMIPVALGSYDKIKIDYDKMETWEVCHIQTKEVMTVREFFKDEILTYQKRDCTALGELVTAWYDRFGNKLTMASAALSVLNGKHGFERMPEYTDKEMRPYYFGGRNQCFATGIITGNFKVYDINSSYPNVMKRFKHPISNTPIYEPKITARTHFAKIRAWSLGALPVRTKDNGLDFPIGTHDFFACIHEIKAGLETKTLNIIKVYHSIYFEQEADFSDFVDEEYNNRLDATARGDPIGRLFHKLVPNSSYGKFAQDPRKYENWLFDPSEIPTPFYCDPCHKRIMKNEEMIPCEACATGDYSPYGWYLHTTRNGRNVYASPQKVRGSGFYNVATAASITSAARANLLRGIHSASRPIYCDTDSIICENLQGADIVIHPTELGGWDIEAEGDTVCIAGKKLYAIFANGNEVKKASKGVKLTADQIRRVCDGEVITYSNPVPKFSLGAEPAFVTRKIKATG